MTKDSLTHIDAQGNAQMVDVTAKAVTEREARAQALISMKPETLSMIVNGEHKKGDVLAVARIAGIQAAKKCSELIPLCHPLMLTSVKVELTPDADNNAVRIEARCKLAGQTGVEMKALTAVPVPKNAGELMQYICALNFFLNKIPMFSEIVSPLRRFLTKCLDGTTRRTKTQATKKSHISQLMEVCLGKPLKHPCT